jgi:hypothetical protein
MTLEEVAQISMTNQHLLRDLLRQTLLANILNVLACVLQIGILIMLWRGEGLLRREHRNT